MKAPSMLHALASFLGLSSDRSDSALSKNATIVVFAPSGTPSRFCISEISFSIASVGVVGTGGGGDGGDGDVFDDDDDDDLDSKTTTTINQKLI
jgi:hypothetical protein